MKFRAIAAKLREESARFAVDSDDTPESRAVFEFGTLKIKCPANRNAILRVAEKYDKGYTRNRCRSFEERGSYYKAR